MDLALQDDEHARETLKLVQYATLENQAPLTKEELWFIYFYPEITRQLLTLTP